MTITSAQPRSDLTERIISIIIHYKTSYDKNEEFIDLGVRLSIAPQHSNTT
jgi:hypothetical protein